VAVHRLQRRQYLAHPPDEVFAFFAAARNLERITPPWLRFEVLTPEPVEMAAGSLLDYRLTLHGVPLGWTSQIEVWEPGRQFVDRAIRGPFGLWHHRHRFAASGGGTFVSDEVHYALPFGALGELAQPLFVARDLDRIFAHRHAAVQRILAAAPVAA
jgi:hypothetical protein